MSSFPPELAPHVDAFYLSLDTFFARIETKYRQDMYCGAGCASCCVGDLTVGGLEATRIRALLRRLPSNKRQQIRRNANRATSKRCVMLDDQDRCQIYEVRPSVCRTQGLMIQYQREKSGEHDVVWCDLNFNRTTPPKTDYLDGDLVNLKLATLNHVFSQKSMNANMSGEHRHSLVDLAGE